MALEHSGDVTVNSRSAAVKNVHPAQRQSAPEEIAASFPIDERVIEERYRTLPDRSVRLLGAYTSRPTGIADIVLSGSVRSSQEVCRLLGDVDAHRSPISGEPKKRAPFLFDLNDYISFTVGFVSFKYFDR